MRELIAVGKEPILKVKARKCRSAVEKQRSRYSGVSCNCGRYCSALATFENVLLALVPISRMVPPPAVE
jgi:hypothetical protein